VDIVNAILILTTLLYSGVALCFFIGLFRPHIPPKDAPQPFLSVVIAARNESDYILACLQSLGQQTYPSDLFEVLVVDDDSTDGTCQIIRNVSKTQANVHLLCVGDQFANMAAKKRPMSVGIRRARGEWIVTTDADCRMPPTWLAQLATYMHTDTDAIIGFSQVGTTQERLTPFEKMQAFDFLSLMSAAAGSANLGFPLASTGQNFAYRKELFDRVGGFSSVSHRPSGDDVLLLQLLRKSSNKRIVFASDPKSFACSFRPETMRGFWRQRKRWASNAAFQIGLNPIFFVYILIVFATHALIPLSLVIHPNAWMIPLGCWVIKSVAYWAVVKKGARVFGRTDLLSVWLIWELLQPFYIILIGIAGTLGGFTWKDRRHR